MRLDLAPLKLAVTQLQKSLNYCDSTLAKQDIDIKEQFNTAAIQVFEYTYELSWKMLKRYLAQIISTPSELDEISFPNLIRLGSEKGLLLSDWSRWKIFRDKRNTTSHTYDLSKAQAVLSILPEFLIETQYLLKQLETKIGKQNAND
jgi:nucleotidyltransferase substrate binding protein (TIGR01987 family)